MGETMRTDVIMPQMGESIQEGTIVKWLKRVGEAIGRDEPLFEISTDKVDAEIPSPAAPSPAARQSPPAGDGGPRAPPLSASQGGTAVLEQRIRTKSSPVVRKIAAEHGVDIAGLSGTGLLGRVTKNDILGYLETRQ